jgi:DNA repair exonuclease SbcCD ATPase subunit
MATLEDAAEELVVKLRGLEAEIDESDHRLEALRARVEDARREVDADWDDLTQAVSSFLERVRDEGEQLERQGQDTAEAVTGAHNALAERASEAQAAVGQAAAELHRLGEETAAHEEAVEPLVHDGVEAPAQALAERVRELEQELGRLVDEARAFLVDEVVPTVEQVTDDVRERCQELHGRLAEECVNSMQEAFDDWVERVDELETYVAQQGYVASHQHALDVVEEVMDQCETASRQHLDLLTQVVSSLEGQLQQLASEVERAGGELVEETGVRLLRELDETRGAAEKALTGLDRVRQELAARSFMEA